MHRTKVQSVHRRVGRPLANRCLGAFGNGSIGLIIGPPVSRPFNHVIQFLLRVIAFPISAIVREEIPVPIDPSSVKRVAHPAGKHSVFTGGCVHPKEGCIPLIFFLTNVARGAAVPNQRPIGHDFNGVGLVVSDRNS